MNRRGLLASLLALPFVPKARPGLHKEVYHYFNPHKLPQAEWAKFPEGLTFSHGVVYDSKTGEVLHSGLLADMKWKEVDGEAPYIFTLNHEPNQSALRGDEGADAERSRLAKERAQGEIYPWPCLDDSEEAQLDFRAQAGLFS